MHIEIRPYLAEDDLDALTDLIHRAYAPHLDLGLRYWATHQSSTDTEKRLLSGMGLIMLADGKYAGTATVRPPQPNSPSGRYRPSWSLSFRSQSASAFARGSARTLGCTHHPPNPARPSMTH